MWTGIKARELKSGDRLDEGEIVVADLVGDEVYVRLCGNPDSVLLVFRADESVPVLRKGEQAGEN